MAKRCKRCGDEIGLFDSILNDYCEECAWNIEKMEIKHENQERQRRIQEYDQQHQR